ncbi:hypothetical protein S40285_00507 [Stachybotrys chlorohalonatus IBT 40285]|uniref:Amidase domain-containing protein n=1 Tax=Stachybotrys chlorohalonatus (strain IBT 40285) TaxID=1283841 RepID=A0A084QNF8_STAC4|nr:hypothetical protein S40285_00507 [Stachybotrys chlorohalonata IBT 40285]
MHLAKVISGALVLLHHIASATGRPGPYTPPLLDASLEDLRDGLESGVFTSVDLAAAYMARVAEVNGELRAVTEINPDALAIAAERDAERRRATSPADLGPLHGIPVLLKDNIATRDRLNTTAGSYALLGARVREDSTVAARLRRAGAVILGKTNMSQWASWRSESTSPGWSAYGGQTVGAYFPGHDPSGSSSGSAVGASIGLAWAALGTETAGSIIHPAHLNNVVGIKPTVGLTSRYLVVPLMEHQDTVGPLARTVRDAAALLSVIVGPDAKDNYTSAIPWRETPDYIGACRGDGRHGLRGKRIGVSRALMALLPDQTVQVAPQVFEAALEVLKSAGAEIVEDIPLPGLALAALNDYNSVLCGADFLTNLPDKYLSLLETNPNNIRSLEDLRNFTHANPLELQATRDTLSWDASLARGLTNRSPAFWGNYTASLRAWGPLGLTGALERHSLDAIVLPSTYASLLAGALGTPVVSVPMGRTPRGSPLRRNAFGNLNQTAPNQPMGLGFAGAAFSELSLIEMAYAYEQRTQWRGRVKPFVQPLTEIADVVGGRYVL